MVFENRDTVTFRSKKCCARKESPISIRFAKRSRSITSLSRTPAELSATLFLEIEDQTHLRDDLLEISWASTKRFFLKSANASIPGRFEEGHSKEDKISAVQYVRFPFDPQARQAFRRRRKRRADHRSSEL